MENDESVGQYNMERLGCGMLARAGGEGKAINAGGIVDTGAAGKADAAVSAMDVDLAYMLERRGAEVRREEELRKGAGMRTSAEVAAANNTGEIGAFDVVCGTTDVAAGQVALGSPDIDIVATGDRRAKEKRVGRWCRVALGPALREMGSAVECDDRESESGQARPASLGES